MKLDSLTPHTRFYLFVAFAKTLAFLACLYVLANDFGDHAHGQTAVADKDCHHGILELLEL